MLEAAPSLPNNTDRLTGALGTIAGEPSTLLNTYAGGASESWLTTRHVGPGDYTQIETANLQFITLCQPHLVTGA